MGVFVSIIIPAYNYGHLIRESLASVVGQTYKSWECIVVNDGSTDNTVEIVETFIKQHPEVSIRLITIANGGTSAAKNAGLKEAKGSLIQFLDADDLLTSNKISCHVEILHRNNAALVFCRSRFFSGDIRDQYFIQQYPKGYLLEESMEGLALIRRLVRNNVFTIAAPLVHKRLLDAVGGFNPSVNQNEDWLLWFKVATLQPTFLFDAEEDVAVDIRIHGISAMRNQAKMALGEVSVRMEMDAILKAENRLLSEELRQMNFDLLALHEIRSVDAMKGILYILANFSKHPVKSTKLLLSASVKYAARLVKSLKAN